jgi:hypothetical protein
MGILIALFVLVGIVVAGVRNVPGGMVGVSVNNLTGEVSLADRVGLHFTIPYVVSFYTIDRTTKQLDMLASAAAPADGATLAPDDFLNVKAKDGDNVKVDVKVQYNIVPEKGVEVLRMSGSDVLELMKAAPAKGADDPIRWKRFERKWIWPVVRAALADRFNELTREEMNEGPMRVAKANAAADDANKLLRDRFGVEITLITVENPTSYQQYELIVRQRKDTDQEVAALIQEQGQELAAQHKQVEDETKKAEIAKATTEATNLIALRAEEAAKDKTIQAAEGYKATTEAAADAKVANDRATAEGKRKTGEAEAARIRETSNALAGSRGTQLIAAEFAKRIKDMVISASPFVYNAIVQPYLMQQGGNLVPSPTSFPNPQPAAQPGAGQK